MRAGDQQERLWRARMRWRMRGAWLWPAFALVTLVEAALLTRLPPYGEGPPDLVAGLLIAAFLNLACVAVGAPLLGRLLRRRRPDLPRFVADNYAGTGLILAGALGLLAAGLAHRPAIAERADDQRAQLTAVHDYVVSQAPDYRAGLAHVDSLALEAEMYRACVPGPDPKRWLCLFVLTDQEPAGVRLDPDRLPNSVYRTAGGFR